MNRITRFLALISVAVALAIVSACSKGDTFRINGILDGFGTGNLRLVYTSADAVQSVTATAVDGKFMALGHTENPTIVRIYTASGNVIGRFIIEPGETLDLHLNLTDPSHMEADGNSDTEKLAGFLADNAKALRTHNATVLNTAIDAYVRKNPAQYLSGLLLTDYYTPQGSESEALSLLASLDAKVTRRLSLAAYRDMLTTLATPLDSLSLPSVMRLFGNSDTIDNVNLRSADYFLIMLTYSHQRASDSILAAVDSLTARHTAHNLRIIDISADLDTAIWHTSLKELTDSGKHSSAISSYWSPAVFSIPELDGIPVARMPWFIAADSTGTVVYNGPSVTAASRVFPR